MCWNAIFRSLKEIVFPMCIVWLVAAVLVLAYYFVPGMAEAIEPVAQWQRDGGWVSALLNRLFFCGLLPGVFLLMRTNGRGRMTFAVIGVQSVFAGFCGIICDWMYTLHARLLGSGCDLGTVMLKTALCQFVWTPLLFVPMGAVVYFWIGRNLSFRRTREEWPCHFLSECYFPNLLANWVIWIPVGMMIHLFPTVLQIQLSGLASAVLSLAFIFLGRNIGRGKMFRR